MMRGRTRENQGDINNLLGMDKFCLLYTSNLAPYLNIIDSCLHFPLLIEQFKGYRFLHLRAERDINKEKIDYASQVTDYKIESNSTGICSLIARMLNDEQGHTAKLTGNNGKEAVSYTQLATKAK